MPGNKIGGRKAAAANLAKNPNYFKEIGKIGGSATFASHGSVKGFAAMSPEKLKEVSAKGGKGKKK